MVHCERSFVTGIRQCKAYFDICLLTFEICVRNYSYLILLSYMLSVFRKTMKCRNFGY